MNFAAVELLAGDEASHQTGFALGRRVLLDPGDRRIGRVEQSLASQPKRLVAVVGFDQETVLESHLKKHRKVLEGNERKT